LPLPQADAADQAWPALPTETEIYILPDGRVIVADLPDELVAAITALGFTTVAAQPVPEKMSND